MAVATKTSRSPEQAGSQMRGRTATTPAALPQIPSNRIFDRYGEGMGWVAHPETAGLCIVAYRGKGAFGASRFAEALGLRPTMVGSRLARLLGAGIFTVHGAGANRTYELTDAGRALCKGLIEPGLKWAEGSI